jgi:hypothetical protein
MKNAAISRRKRGVDREEKTTDLSEHEHKKNTRRSGHKLTFLVALLVVSVLVVGSTQLFISPRSALSALEKTVEQIRAYTEIGRYDNSDELQNCYISFQPPPPKETGTWTTKPLWLPGFPSSGAEANGEADRAKPLVRLITGLQSGAKSYHAASKQLKRCSGLHETATCSQVHPIVPIKPEELTSNFSPNVILSIRNFSTVFPVSNDRKANLYHGVVGQLPEDRWRKLRDEYVEKAFHEWKGLVATWKSMDYYKISMYLPYEHLLDRTKGPDTAQRLADQLEAAGFEVAPPSDMPCIWYTATHGPMSYEREHMKYTPGYTTEQRDFMLNEMNKMMVEMADDKDLVAILQEYHADIRDHTRIDKPWTSSGITAPV